MDSRSAMYVAIQAGNISLCQLLVREFHIDPFFLATYDENDDRDDETAASPFLAAARQPDTGIFEYFLELWDERFFSSNGGKNSDGKYPIHVICCDPRVSLQAIQLLVNRQAETVSIVDGEQSLLPFHFAAMCDTSLEVIFFLLRHCPNTVHHVGTAAVPAVLDAGATNGSTFTVGEINHDNNDDAARQGHDGFAAGCCGPVKKKAKMVR
jgi:hypothetical protein